MEFMDTNRKVEDCSAYRDGDCKARIPVGPCSMRPTCTYWRWGGGPQFPIMDEDGPLQAIPWTLMAPHYQQARNNHSQTLKRLAERGGLSPIEAVAVLEDKPYPWHTGVNDEPKCLAEQERCRAFLVRLVKREGRP